MKTTKSGEKHYSGPQELFKHASKSPASKALEKAKGGKKKDGSVFKHPRDNYPSTGLTDSK